MSRRWIALLLLLASALAAADPREIAREIERAQRQLSEITGLAWRRPIRFELIDRSRVERFMRDRMKEAVKPEEIAAEELTLKKFGFAPPEFDLAKSTIDLLTEQAAAFYDFRKKKLFLTDWASLDMQDSALVHEVAHALADQHFNLGRFIEESGKSDDSALARMAVMEGQASWLMSETQARRRGQTLIGRPEVVATLSRPSDPGVSAFPVYNSVPLYLRETLVFPYTSGLRFQSAVADREGKPAFSEVFRRPPVSSQQILHPEKYFAQSEPTVPEAPRPPTTKGFRKVAEGMVGELDFAILLEQHSGKADAVEIAPHWRGGVYTVWQRKDKTASILAFAVEWDSDEIARRFLETYERIQTKKWRRREVGERRPEEIAGTGDDGRFVVRRSGRVVTVLEGLDSLARAGAR